MEPHSDDNAILPSSQGKKLVWEILEEENERWIDEHTTDDAVYIDQQNPIIPETVEPPPDLIKPLLKHQKEFLAWGIKQELTLGGGILADEIGMGKTIQAIALVLAKREVDKSAGSTLVVCPHVVFSHWLKEISQATSPGSTTVFVYHGGKRNQDVKDIEKYDFVLTTYTTLEDEYKSYIPQVECIYCGESFSPQGITCHLISCKERNDEDFTDSKMKQFKKQTVVIEEEGSLLHSVKWNRIILDEAHRIKNTSKTNTETAACALKANYRWALTGTRVENNCREFDSLISFLKVFPYSYYFCEDCNCNVLDRGCSKQKRCPSCSHYRSRHFCWWTTYVAKPTEEVYAGRSILGKRAQILRNHKIIKDILLRRTKLGCEALPPRVITVRRDELDQREADFYQKLHKAIQEESKPYLEGRMIWQQFERLRGLLIRLRKADNHRYLVAGNGIEQESAEEDTERTTKEHQARKTRVKGFSALSIINKIDVDNFQTSTKIEALREEIRLMLESDASAKAIVFSHFAEFLDLIHYALGKSGIDCSSLAGKMSTEAKNAAIKKFKEDPDRKILLLGLRSGGLDHLNLTVASHVFLMDPWWNSTVEMQVYDRIHMIGQYKPIKVMRFIIENTVEENILALLKKRELSFQGAVGGYYEGLTSEDVELLFS